jgi:ABC-type protease/lipase transport system fused ATPase/permease subunit
MRLCQPYLAALRRTLIGTSLIGCIQAGLWLVASLILATLIDLRLAGQPLAHVLPWAIAICIAASGAVLLSLTRLTLLNRRRVWIDHALGEKVVEYEVWVAADGRQRARSLAAVAVLGRYAGSTAARALADTPWALMAIGAVWFVDMDLAVVASAGALVLIIMTIASVYVSPRAHTFDHSAAAHTEGDAVVRGSPINPDAVPEQARAAARNWEATQGAHLATLYSTAQASGRRRIGAGMVLGCAAAMMGALLLERPVSDGHTVGNVVAMACLIMAALAVLARGAIGAPLTAQARAARTHLLLLRHGRNRPAPAPVLRPVGPDIRLPLAASFTLTAATLAALVATQMHWNLPTPVLGAIPAAPVPANKTTDAAPAIPLMLGKDKS